MRKFSFVLAGALAALAGSAAAAVAAPAPKVKVVASGLNSPKHLLYTGNGLYVVESGTGGPQGTSNCVTAPATEGPGNNTYCVGSTGAVALIKGHKMKVALSGLASEIDVQTGGATGPSAVTVNDAGALSVLYQDDLVQKDGSTALPAPASTLFGTFQIAKGISANLAAFAAANPQAAATLGGIPGTETTYDSDPYDVIPYKQGYVVTDAAANDLLSVSKRGKIKLIARFPTLAESVPAGILGPYALTIDAQAVPTAVAVGPDGALYVSELRGIPSAPATASIYRVKGNKVTVWASGLTAVTAIAFDSKGRLLATELSTGGLLAAPKVPGALVRINANGKKVTTLPVSGLTEPTGVAVAPNGTVYIVNNGTSAGTATNPGEVLSITGLK
ncbi:MAG: ScyD/ScyE family protein [Solirubrobacteraceae bacterium]